MSHFNFKRLGTFKQKYLIDTSKWNRAARGPIIFYCGNEGPVEMFFNNSGYYNENVAKELQGMVLYMEHRYFGVSMPFGTEKASFEKENLVYLTTEEATMDYVVFLQDIKKKYCPDCPVIAFGGSYAGMLASWMRMKYPHVVDMAHSASGPIYYFANRQQNFDLSIFYQIVTRNYQMHSQNCPDVIREGFKRLLAYSSNISAPIAFLSTYFNLCKPIKTYQDIPLLMNYINDAYAYMAMLNYPYPTNFLKKLPGWPANSSCIPLSSVTKNSSDKDLFSALRLSIEYYYNYEGGKCNDIYSDSSSDQDMSGWNVLACSDEAMPMNMDGSKDMFYKDNFDYAAYSKYCFDTYGIEPDYNFTLQFFGGITDKEYLSASRIIFTNGNLDPWSGASPISSLNENLPACYITYGAHHLDLRPPNDLDPPDAVMCRSKVLEYLKKWLQEVRMEKELEM